MWFRDKRKAFGNWIAISTSVFSVGEMELTKVQEMPLFTMKHDGVVIMAEFL